MISSRLWQIMGWTMLHYFWIGAALGVAAFLMRRRLRSAAANVRYLFALGSLLMLSVAPAAIGVFVSQTVAPKASGELLAAAPTVWPEAGRAEPAPLAVVKNSARLSVMDAESSPPVAVAQDNGQWLAALDWAAIWLPWLWVSGAPLTFALTTAGLLGAERLRRQSHPLEDVRITEMCRQLAASLRISYRVSVAVCDRIAAPILVGILRPMILLPAVALAGWDPQQLEMVLLHELAHVRRYDNLVNLLQRIVESVLFFHPMVWIASSWVRHEREHCCDELVVARTRQPQAYAEMLVTLADRLAPSSLRGSSFVHPQAVSSMAERPLVARIRRILEKEEQAMQVSRISVAFVLAGFLVVAVAIGGYSSLPSRADDASEPSKRSSNDTAAGKSPAENSSSEALTYTGLVADKLTGKPIAEATVTVRLQILAPFEHRIIEEPNYTTDAAGKYTFTIPPEQVADRYMYIELDVSHPDYATRKGFGYSLTMIRKNEKLGERPFFEHVDLYPADTITGTVVAPDGTPMAGMKVRGFTMPDQKSFDSASFTDATTDAQGVFRLNLSKGSKAVFWLLPKNYAPSTHVIDEKRGDLGRFTLENGVELKGYVVDEQEKPVAGVWLNAEIVGGAAKKSITLPVTDFLSRSALSDDKGRFTLAPLPPGECLVRVDEYTHDGLLGRQSRRPLPAVFGPKKLTLKVGETPGPIEIRAVPQVVIEGQYYDSQGKPRMGHEPDLCGRLGDKNLGDRENFVFLRGDVDKNGRFVIRAPKGLLEAKLDIITNEHSALRVRMMKGGPLSNRCRDIELGTLDQNIQGIKVVRYEAPILLVKPLAADGSLLGEAEVQFEYAEGRGPWTGGGRYVDGKDVSFEKQPDGFRRTSQLLPDEEFTVTVTAKGYEQRSEKLTLPEGATKQLEMKLEPAAPKPDGQAGGSANGSPQADVDVSKKNNTPPSSLAGRTTELVAQSAASKTTVVVADKTEAKLATSVSRPEDANKPAEAQTDASDRRGVDDENYAGVRFHVETSLADGVKRFNDRIAKLGTTIGVGKGQPPLTEDEVVTAIRGWIPEQHPVNPEVLKIFREIAETRKLPPGSSITYIPSWIGYNGFFFEVWWVDLCIGPVDGAKKDPVIGYGYHYRIRDQKIRSRPMTEEEKQRIQEEGERFERRRKGAKATEEKP